MVEPDRFPTWFYPYGPRVVYTLVVALGVLLMSLFSFVQGRQAQARATEFLNTPDCGGPGQGQVAPCVTETARIRETWYGIGRGRPPGLKLERADGALETLYFPVNDQAIIGAATAGAQVELQIWQGQITAVRFNGIESHPNSYPLAAAEGWQLGARAGAWLFPALLLIAAYLALRQWLLYRALSGPWP